MALILRMDIGIGVRNEDEGAADVSIDAELVDLTLSSSSRVLSNFISLRYLYTQIIRKRQSQTS